MEVLIFQKEAFEEMAAKFSRFSDRVNELLAKQGGKSLNHWMDNQEVCQQLNISRAQSYAVLTLSMFHKRCLMFHQKHKSFGALRIMP